MGYEFEVMRPDFDEKSVRHEDPAELVRTLAHRKADVLLPQILEPSILITADTVGICDGKVLEKPVDADEVRAFYKLYENHPCGTVGAVVVTDTATGKRIEGVDIAAVHLAPIPEHVVEALISEGAVFNYAGAITLYEPLLQPYVLKIEGEVESLEGLPKALTMRLLGHIGVEN